MTATRLLAARTKIKTLVRADQIAVVVARESASFSDPQDEETRRNSADAREDIKIGGRRLDCCQIRLRVIHMKKMNATTNPAAISIQY